MADSRMNDELNQLVVSLGRSLLQYVGECWPWTRNSAEAERAALHTLIQRQQQCCAALIEMLSSRNASIDMGAYPTDYTDLHYVSLDFLLSQLIANERVLIGELEQALADSIAVRDNEAHELVEQLLGLERENLAALEDLSCGSSAEAAATGTGGSGSTTSGAAQG